MIINIPTPLGRLLLPAVLLLAACRGNTAEAVPTLAPTAIVATAPAPTPRPVVTLTATPVLPFPAPPVGEYAEGDATLPTRTPTAQAPSAAGLPAPVCNGPTPATPEDPTYVPNTPERTDLFEAGMTGDRVTLTGYVLDANCRPIPGAWLDFWQADADGVYDTAGYRLRGHQFTDASGRYRLETLIPGPVDGGAPVLHVRLLAPGVPMLSTRLFFPDQSANVADPQFQPALLVTALEPGAAAFDFVLE